MKKLMLLIIIIWFCASSCQKNFLDVYPTSSITAGNFYHTQQDIKQAVNGVYGGMRDWPVDIFFYLSEIRSNNYYVTSDGAQRDWFDISNFSLNAQDGTFHDTWQSLYQMINRANEVLGNIDNVPFDTAATRSRYKAETRFLRAYAYFQLVRIWGNVPLIDKVVSPNEALQIKQSKPADIYKFITSEMSSVIDSLPLSFSAGDMANAGRLSGLAAEGILARVYLTEAGYPLHQTQMLDSARIMLKDVVDHEGQTDYTTFTANYGNLFGVANDNKHNLFEIQYISGGLGEGSSFPSQSIPPNLNNSLVSVKSLLFTTAVQVSQNLLDSYNPNDLRFNVTIDTSYTTSDNPPRHANTPFFKKFVDFGLTNLTNYDDWPENYPLLRYGDVLLMYAEVLNDQAGTPPAEAITILNRIRNRAGLAPVAPATKEDFALALETERRHEFADEGQYWFDLVRTERAIPVMNAWFKATSQNINIDEHDLLYPIPQSEIDISPGLYTQNPGYN